MNSILWTILICLVLFITVIFIIYLKEKDDSGKDIVEKFDQQHARQMSMKKLSQNLLSRYIKK